MQQPFKHLPIAYGIAVILTFLLLKPSFLPTKNLAEASGLFSEKAKTYFQELAFGSEYGSSNKIRKWTKTLKVAFINTPPAYLKDELLKIIDELKIITPNLTIELLANAQEADCRIFTGSLEVFAEKHEPSSKVFLGKAWGVSIIYPDDKGNILAASIAIDIDKSTQKEVNRHLLREEFTQSLGLMQDSEQYSESIFYQGFTNTTQYAPIDKEVIAILYHPKIYANMQLQEVLNVLKDL